MTPRDIIAADLTSARAEIERLKAALQTIHEVYEARSELFANDADCAGNLADRARKAVEGREGLKNG